MLSRYLLIFYFLLLSSLLSSCVTPKNTPRTSLSWSQQSKIIQGINQWTLRARVAIRHGSDSNSLNLNWQKKDSQQVLNFYSVIGTNIGILSKIDSVAKLELSKDEIYTADSLSELISQVIGVNLPIAQLQNWILGLNSTTQDNTDDSMQYNELGYPKFLKYKTWMIQYDKFKTFPEFKGMTLPSKIKISHRDLTVKLSIKSWSMNTEL